MKNRIVALLPMKANSERVKGKNFKKIAGKPLFQWILDTLLSVDVIDQIVINTDAQDLLEKSGIDKSDRILIRNRKNELLGDMTSMNLILEDDINNVDADIYLMTHTTNPLLKPKTIYSALDEFNKGDHVDSLFTVNRIQTRFYRDDRTPVNHNPGELLRTQDLEPWFEENSCLYLFTADSFEKTRSRIGKTPIMYETQPLESIDIDEADDWIMAEAVLEWLKRKNIR